MADIINPDFLNSTLAFGATYLLHSTVWILTIALLIKLPIFKTASFQNLMWKTALLGGLVTSIYAFVLQQNVYELPIVESIEIVEDNGEAFQNVTTKEELKNTIDEMPPEESLIQNIPLEEENSNTVLNERNEKGSSFDFYFLLPVLLFLWGGGVLFLILKVTLQHYHFFKKIGRRKPLYDTELGHIFLNIQDKAQTEKRIWLTASPYLDSPIVVQNKEICLPQKAIETLDEEQLEAMIAHEWAHIIRKDYYWRMLILVMEILFFFQPLHYLIKKGIDQSTELLCDAWAAKTIGNSLALAECLVKVAAWIKPSSRSYTLVAGMALKQSELSNRVKQLIKFKVMKTKKIQKLSLGATLGALLLLLMIVLPGFSYKKLVLENPEEITTLTTKENASNSSTGVLEEPTNIDNEEGETPKRSVSVLSQENADVTGVPSDGNMLNDVEHHFYTKGGKETGVVFKLEKEAKVIVEIISENKGKVTSVFSGTLGKGENSISYPHKKLKPGYYFMSVAINSSKNSYGFEVSSGVNYTDPSDEGCRDLLRAAKGNDVGKVRELVKTVYPNCIYRKDGEPRTAINAAARNGNVEIGKILLDAGGSVEATADGDASPLTAASREGHLPFVKMLIERGAKINRKDDGDGSALIMAAHRGHKDIVAYLIRSKADVNIQVGGDGTPLIGAARNGHYEIAEMLLEQGADPLLNSPGDENPLYHAMERGDKKMIKLLTQYMEK